MLTIRATDEAIWHFIGIFHTNDEVVRLRLDYEKFAPPRPDYDPGQIDPKDTQTHFPFKMPEADPHLVYRPQPPSGANVENGADYAFLDPERGPLPGSVFPLGGHDKFAEAAASGLWGFRDPPDRPDRPDRPDPPDPPIPPEEQFWTLPPPGSVSAIILQQTALWDDDLLHSHDALLPVSAGAELAQLYAQAGGLGVSLAVALPENEAAFVDMARAFGEGECPDDLPPEATVFALQGDAVEGAFLNGQPVTAAPQIDELMPAYRAEIEADDGHDNALRHELVLGNNMLLNEASIVSAWIAAPVMSAGLGIYSYTIVSQVNIFGDFDRLFGPGSTQVSVGGTNALNYASFTNVSNPVPYGRGEGDAPQYWITATLQGSLISFNWIDQYNFISDDDVTTVTFHGDKTLMLIGENGTMNAISLSELGYQFDLIIVDGYIINLNAILQTNVLLDNDTIVLGANGGHVSSGDNLLLNSASITRIGETHYGGSNTALDGIVRLSGDGPLVLPPSVLNDPSFAGLDVVRVLHITGDMVSVNMIRQTNVLGDSDRVDVLAREAVNAGGDVRVIAGSNVLVNDARITEHGVDTTLYTSGEYYSDALLHQAELVSEPSGPQGAPALASEAVLFLADGMIGENDDHHAIAPLHHDSGVSSDVMETVLA